MSVIIKPACYTISKAYMDNLPVEFLTGQKPSADMLQKIRPNGNVKILFIPFEGWNPNLLGTMFRWCRERYDSQQVRRQDTLFDLSMIHKSVRPKNIYDFLPKENKDDAETALTMLETTLRLGVSQREDNPIVELIPWRYCRFVYIFDGAESWVDFDGTLIVPIKGNPNGNQKKVLSELIKGMLFRVLKNHRIYPDESSPEITIGLDPELSVYRVVSGKGRISEHITARDIIGSRNCDLKVGTDGCDSIFEFRPEASTDIDVVVNSVEDCIRGLAYKLGRHGLTKVFGLSGGGCGHSLGGHIHIGNERIKKLSQADLQQLGKMLDDFLYFPIRDRMTGAIRTWVNLPNISQQSFGGPLPRFSDIEQAKESMKEITRFGRAERFAGYDGPSQWRQKSYGYEYRSLPSFIVNREFTYLVLEMTKRIATKFYELCTEGTTFEYQNPPKTEDYRAIFSEEIVTSFMRYVNGDKREIFMDNVFENWGIKTGVFSKPVNVQRLINGNNMWGERGTRDEDDLTEIGHKITRRFHSIMKYLDKHAPGPINIYFQSTSPGNATFSVYSRGWVAHRNGNSGAAPDYSTISNSANNITIQHGTGLRKTGYMHACKQALVMELYHRIGRSAPRRYERLAEVVRNWVRESENTYGPIITSDFQPMNQG